MIISSLWWNNIILIFFQYYSSWLEMYFKNLNEHCSLYLNFKAMLAVDDLWLYQNNSILTVVLVTKVGYTEK